MATQEDLDAATISNAVDRHRLIRVVCHDGGFKNAGRVFDADAILRQVGSKGRKIMPDVMGDGSRQQGRGGQTAASRYRHRGMGCLRREVAYRDLTTMLWRRDDADLGDCFTV